MLGWTLNKGKPITGQTGHPRVYLPNRRHGKLDNLSHNAHKPDRLSQGAMQNTLNERGCRSPKRGNKQSFIKESTWGQAEFSKDQPSNRYNLQPTLQEARQEA